MVPTVIYGYVMYELHVIEEETQQYLINQGYHEEEIENIEGHIQKLSLFTVDVIFTDEVGVTYQYKKQNGEIIQIGTELGREEGMEYKHME